MHCIGLSHEGVGHILDQIFREPMAENVEIPLEIQHDMVATPRYKTGQGVLETFKQRRGTSKRVRLNQPIVDPEWLVCYHY